MPLIRQVKQTGNLAGSQAYLCTRCGLIFATTFKFSDLTTGTLCFSGTFITLIFLNLALLLLDRNRSRKKLSFFESKKVQQLGYATVNGLNAIYLNSRVCKQRITCKQQNLNDLVAFIDYVNKSK